MHPTEKKWLAKAKSYKIPPESHMNGYLYRVREAAMHGRDDPGFFVEVHARVGPKFDLHPVEHHEVGGSDVKDVVNTVIGHYRGHKNVGNIGIWNDIYEYKEGKKGPIAWWNHDKP